MTESEKISVRNTNALFLQQLCALPLGIFFPFGGTTAPNGFAICEGQALSKTTYPDLFNAIGYFYSGETQSGDIFYLPDTRGKVIVGFKDGHAEFGVFGATVGEDSHTLTVDEMPSHKHDYKTGLINVSEGAGGTALTINSDNNTRDTTYAGGSLAHNNIQTSLVGNYIIKLTSIESDWNELISQEFDPDSAMAMSGMAIAAQLANYVKHEDLANVATSGSYNDLSDKPTVDSIYSPTSDNAQSGVAVAEAIEDSIGDINTILATVVGGGS